MTVQEFFDTLPERVDPAKTAGMNNTYVFDVAGRGHVDRQGRGRRGRGERGAAEDADCTITASEETFAKIVAGESNADVCLHDGEAEDRGRHGRRAQAAEAVLS